MRVIAGLGNPGAKYEATRHNVGFMVVERLRNRWGIPLSKSLCQARVGEGSWRNHPVMLALPQTSMNLSGESAGRIIRRLHLDPSKLLILCDDVSLPLGMIRLRGKGSDGGHRGLASVLEAAGSLEVPRLRVGIAGAEPLPKDLTAYVLNPFKKSEEKVLEKVLASAVEACEVWLDRGLSAAMNLFNTKGSLCDE